MPPRPPNTASLLYYHQKLKAGELDHIHGTTRLFHAIEQFRKLSDHKKRKYRQKHKEVDPFLFYFYYRGRFSSNYICVR